MHVRENIHIGGALILIFALCMTKIHCCWTVERTEDKCRSSNSIDLKGDINQRIGRGSSRTLKISEHVKELYWYCGSSRERVAWGGGANTLRVSFSGSTITWEFSKCPPDGCVAAKTPEKTTDRCRSGGHIWLEGGVNKTVLKGKSSDAIDISRHMREMIWRCGDHGERVVWAGSANLLQVHFETGGAVKWEFYSCKSPARCQSSHSAMQVNLETVSLKSKPTDNVAFGWESLFGKPADEIVVNLETKECYTKSKTREIKQDQTLYYGNSVKLNLFGSEPVKFWLSEEDGGFEGKNDLSQLVKIQKSKMDAIKIYLDKNPEGWFDLDHSVTVKGKNIFQENKWLGLLAENLCINVLDFATGPWTGFGRKLALNAASKKLIGRFQSGNIARLYKTLEVNYKAGTLTKNKKEIFRAVMTYQFREGLKSTVKGIPKTFGKKMQDQIKEWALNQTELDDQVKLLVTTAVREGVYNVGGENGLAIYDEVSKKLGEFSSVLDKLTGSLEFCLSEVLPPARDALYHVHFTVAKPSYKNGQNMVKTTIFSGCNVFQLNFMLQLVVLTIFMVGQREMMY